PYHAQGFRRLRRHAAGCWKLRCAGAAAAAHGGRAHRARAAGGVPAGLRLHDADLHVSQRRPASGALTPKGPSHHTNTATRERLMDPASAKLIGAGLAAIGTGAAAIGVGNLFGQFLQGALRNPSAADGQFGRLIFGFAVTEALGIFALLIAFLLLFT